MTYCSSDDRQPAFLKMPALAGGESPKVECSWIEMRGKRLILESPVPVPNCAAVSIEFEDALYLGEVVKAYEENGQWQVEIGVEQILSGLQSLIALREHLLCERVVFPSVIAAGSRN